MALTRGTVSLAGEEKNALISQFLTECNNALLRNQLSLDKFLKLRSYSFPWVILI